LTPLRVDARHNVFDRAVFAGRVHRLKDEQQGPAVLGVEHVLLFRQPRNAEFAQLRGLALVQLQAAGITRIEVLEPEVLAFRDAEWVDVFLYTIEDFFSWYTIEDFFSWHVEAPFRWGAICARWVVGSNLHDPQDWV
jgi:hypothetical protein